MGYRIGNGGCLVRCGGCGNKIKQKKKQKLCGFDWEMDRDGDGWDIVGGLGGVGCVLIEWWGGGGDA